MLDPKFRREKGRYVAQCTLATLILFIVLMVLDAIANAAVIGALGASSFIAFTMPHAQVARPRYLIGGYAVGMLAGALCYLLRTSPAMAAVPVIQDSPDVIFGALAVGLAIFIMVVTNLEHPPAASLALGLVLNECNVRVIVVVSLGVVLLAVLKTLAKPYLHNLL